MYSSEFEPYSACGSYSVKAITNFSYFSIIGSGGSYFKNNWLN